MRKRFEDYEVGQVFRFEASPISRSDITEFAHEWDPQAIHIDEDVAKEVHGSLIASGWQTLLMAMRPVMKEMMAISDVIGAAGVNDLKWIIPVRPDDQLLTRVEVTDKIPSNSKPDRGIVVIDVHVENQNAEAVMTLTAPVMMKRREPDTLQAR